MRPIYYYNRLDRNNKCSDKQCPDCPIGACCINGTCMELTELECIENSGIFYGEGTLCTDELIPCTSPSPTPSPTPPPPPPYQWACCLPAGGCITATYEECVAMGGEFLFGTTCLEATCTPAPEPSPS